MFKLDVEDNVENIDTYTQSSTVNDECETILDSLITKSQALVRDDVYSSNFDADSVNSIAVTRKLYFKC